MWSTWRTQNEKEWMISINTLWQNLFSLPGFQPNRFKFKRGDQKFDEHRHMAKLQLAIQLDPCGFIMSSCLREAQWLDGCCQRSSLVWGSHGLPWELSLRLVLGSSVLQSPSRAKICKPSTALCWHRPWESLGMLEYHRNFQPWHHVYDVLLREMIWLHWTYPISYKIGSRVQEPGGGRREGKRGY